MAADWTPDFPGQRPPFEPGNEAAVQHGAFSERYAGPLAQQIETEARADPSWPLYLAGPEYAGAVRAWARAEAVVALLFDWLSGMDLAKALSETETAMEDTEPISTGRRKKSASKRTASALMALERWEGVAARHRERLGLDPTSRAKLIKDDTVARAVAQRSALDALQAKGDQIIETARKRGVLAPAEPSKDSEQLGGSDANE